jgi:sRNA-binding regulator protein Hfq
MNGNNDLPGPGGDNAAEKSAPSEVRGHKRILSVLPMRMQAAADKGSFLNRQTELFYLQKQIQAQTPMVIVLEDGEHIEGCIEWYDGEALKVRGRGKVLVYKSAIKYMYKLGEGHR